jgi:hypothetical protein
MVATVGRARQAVWTGLSASRTTIDLADIVVGESMWPSIVIGRDSGAAANSSATATGLAQTHFGVPRPAGPR